MLRCTNGGEVHGVSKDHSVFKKYGTIRPTTERDILQQFRFQKLKPRRSKRL